MYKYKKGDTIIYECPKDSISCANSFSEPKDDDDDEFNCVMHDEEIVEENYCCEDYN